MRKAYLLVLTNQTENINLVVNRRSRIKCERKFPKRVSRIKNMEIVLSKYFVSDKSLIEVNKDLKIPKNKGIIVQDLSNLVSELEKMFPDRPWDLEKPKAKKLLKDFQIVRVEKTFTGLQVENMLGMIDYISCTPTEQSLLDLPKPDKLEYMNLN